MRTKKTKKTRGISLATLLIAIVISTVAFAQNTTQPVNFLKLSTCNVTESEVITYLEGYGYSNINLTAVNGTTRATACDWIADTDYSYNTYIDCSETAIIGHEDQN